MTLPAHKREKRSILRQQVNQSTTWTRRALLLARALADVGLADEGGRILKLDKGQARSELNERRKMTGYRKTGSVYDGVTAAGSRFLLVPVPHGDVLLLIFGCSEDGEWTSSTSVLLSVEGAEVLQSLLDEWATGRAEETTRREKTHRRYQKATSGQNRRRN